MKQPLLTLTIVFTLLFSNSYSQNNYPRVSPVHSGAHSSSTNKTSYVVGKIYVLPPPVSGKKDYEDVAVTNNIKIYPNPVTNVLTVETSDKSEVKFITISDIAGKLVYSDKLENNSIDISFLKQGTYIIKLDNDNNKTFKIIKN